MFIKTIDEAAVRYTLPDGTEIAFAYDEFAANPVTDYGYPIGIVRVERNALETDPTGVLEAHDRLAEELEELEYAIEEMRKDYGSDVVDKAIAGELEESSFEWFEEDALERIGNVRAELKAITYLEWQDREEYGWPTYRIAYREVDLIAEGWNAEKLDEIVKGMAREYSAWASGSVYVMGIEVPGEEGEYVTCLAGFDPYDEQEVKDIVLDHVASTDGLTRA